MNKKTLTCTIATTVLCLTIANNIVAGPTLKAPITVGYYPAWGAYNGFSPSNIPAANYDIINYAFGNIGNDCTIALGYPDIDTKNFAELAKLKSQNPNLKVMYSIGGWNNSNNFSPCAQTAANRQKLADSMKSFLANNTVFDGIDLDWEYPATLNDQTNFAALVNTMATTLNTAAGKGKYYITIAGPGANVAAVDGQGRISSLAYANMAANLDFVNIMNYDYHGPWENETNNLAPLFKDTSPRNPDPDNFNIDSAIKAYQAIGVPTNKLVMGVPFYGVGWTDVSPDSYSNSVLYVPGRPLSEQIPYKKIFSNYLNQDPTKNTIWNNESKSIIYYKDKTLISFDDPKTISAKANYITTNKLLGAMYWEISEDTCDKDSLAYQMSTALGRVGGKVYSCVPNYKLEVTNTGQYGLNAVSIVDNGNYYPLPTSKGNYWDPNLDIVYQTNDGPSIANLIGKTNLTVLLTRSDGTQQWCGGDPQHKMTFDFTKNYHLMVSYPYGDHPYCDFQPLP